jgi:nitrous oxidase accessory protein
MERDFSVMERAGKTVPIVLAALLLGLSGNLAARTWIAEPAGKPSIQYLLDAAAPGDTIRVMPGHYKQGNIIIRKAISIVGVDFPMLDGENKYEILTVAADNVAIIGLTLINTGTGSISDISAISAIESSGLFISGNKLEDTFFGIHLANCSKSTISGNRLRSTRTTSHQVGNGIHAWKCDSLSINGNEVSGHRDGIYFEFVTNSIVQDNFSYGNMRYGLHFMFSHHDQYHRNTFKSNGAGVAVMYTQDVVMTENIFEENWGAASYGLLLKDIRDSHIDRNHFSKNTTAIFMEGSSRCSFASNWFSGNGWAVKIQASCDDNTFSGNSFLSNTFDIATNGSLVLNNFDHNYWDTYSGYDLDHDGVGDIAHRPVSLYSMVVESLPVSIMLWRSFLVHLLDRTERVVPSVIPETLQDNFPLMQGHDRNF